MLDQLSGCECAYLAVKEAVKHGDKEALCGRGGGGGRGCGGGRWREEQNIIIREDSVQNITTA